MKHFDLKNEMIRFEKEGDSLSAIIPAEMFFPLMKRIELFGKKFVRYKEGAYLYSISEREFKELAKDAQAIHRYKGVVFVSIEKIDRFLEYNRDCY